MKMKLQLFFIFFLFLTNAFAQTPDILKDIAKKERDLHLKSLKKYKETRQYTYAEKEALKVQREDIINSRVHLIAIKEKSVLVNIKTEELFSNSKEIISKAFTLQDYEGYFYLISKGNKVKYKVKAKDTSNLKDIVSMYERPKFFNPEKKKIDYNLTNNNFKFNYEFGLSLGYANSSFINEVASIQEHTSNFIAYDFDLTADWNFPIVSGISLQYEKQYAIESDVEYNMNSFLIGALFEYQNTKSFLKGLNLGMKLYIDIVSRLNTSSESLSQKINLSKNVFSFYISRPFYHFEKSQLIWSLAYTKQWIKAKAVSSLYNINSNTNKNNILLLSLKFRGPFL